MLPPSTRQCPPWASCLPHTLPPWTAGSEGVLSVVRALREDPKRAQELAARAQNVSNTVLATERIARYWRAALVRYAAVQGFNPTLP
eukprot:9494817-Pyramimonas_sp.AAC.1